MVFIKMKLKKTNCVYLMHTPSRFCREEDFKIY